MLTLRVQFRHQETYNKYHNITRNGNTESTT